MGNVPADEIRKLCGISLKAVGKMGNEYSVPG
jgi:hypothetical protein